MIYPVIEIASVDKKCVFIEHNNDKYIYFEIPVQNVKIEIEHWSGGHMNYDMQFTEGISFLLQYFFDVWSRFLEIYCNSGLKKQQWKFSFLWSFLRNKL